LKVLIVIAKNPKHRFLVTLHTDGLIKEVKELIRKKRHSQAIVSALFKGRFEREIRGHELPGLEADLILSENTASWDHTVKA